MTHPIMAGIRKQMSAEQRASYDRLRAKTAKWDIRTELDSSHMLDVSTGEVSDPQPIIRVSYRPAGQRGRFCTFVIVGEMPDDLPAVVSQYNAERGPQKWRAL